MKFVRKPTSRALVAAITLPLAFACSSPTIDLSHVSQKPDAATIRVDAGMHDAGHKEDAGFKPDTGVGPNSHYICSKLQFVNLNPGPDIVLIGDAAAPITMTWFIDSQGPFDRRFYGANSAADSVFPHLNDLYVKTGQIRVLLQHFPLSTIHSMAESFARAIVCANRQGSGPEMLDQIMSQDDSTISRQTLSNFASTLGLDVTQFDLCFESQGITTHIRRDFDRGVEAGVAGVPTFVLYDHASGRCQVVTGAHLFQVFLDAIRFVQTGQ